MVKKRLIRIVRKLRAILDQASKKESLKTRWALPELNQTIPALLVLRFLNQLTFRNFFGVNRIWHENAPFDNLPTQQGPISCNTHSRIFAH